jgi:hypothetical protein
MLKTFFIAFYLLFLIIIPAKVGGLWFTFVASKPQKGDLILGEPPPANKDKKKE